MAASGHANRAAKLADTFNKAVQLQVAGRFAEAAGLYDGLLRQAPNHPDILDLYGTLWHQVGDNRRAADLVGRSIARRPLAGATQNRYGSILRVLGRRRPAASAFRRAALVDPGLVEPLTNTALVLAEAGDHVRCLAWCARALAVSPGSVDALLRRASVLNALRRFDAASIDLAAAGRRYPIHPEIWLQRMIARSGLGDPIGALRSARAGMVIAPTAFEFYAGLVSSRDPTMDTDTATDGFVRWARRAVTLNPREGMLWGNLGLELYRAASPEAAFQAARRGVLLSPGAASTIQALVSSGLQSERLPLTRTACRRGLMAHPGIADVAAILASVEFIVGDLALAWDLYRSRVERRVFVPRIGSPPAWEGPGSESGPLLVASEQGVGDEVIFLSCLPDLLAAVRVPVVVEVDARIVPVIARSFPAVTVIPRQLIHSAEAGEAFDHTAVTAAYGLRHCVLAGDLPRYFRRDRARPSPRGGYLTPAPERVDHWRRELTRFRPNLVVGVVWRSALMTRYRARFHAEILDWAPVFRTPGCTFVNLMHGDVGEEIERLRVAEGVEIQRLDGIDLWNDIDELMALLAALDVVVAARTANCAFAAAVGTPTIRMAQSYNRICDGRDFFFANMQPALPKDAPFDPRRAAEAGARLLAEQVRLE